MFVIASQAQSGDDAIQPVARDLPICSFSPAFLAGWLRDTEDSALSSCDKQ